MRLVVGDTGKDAVEVGAGECPVEGLSDLDVMILEGQVSSLTAISVSANPSSAVIRIEYEPRALHLASRPLFGPSDPLKLSALLVAQFNSLTNLACHHHQGSALRPRLLQ